eukprot:SAG11_NODE_153_length_14352_cov_24.348323_12_plen_122_part_00
MGVDILPSELPREASAHFGEAMLPFVPGLANSDPSLTFEDQVGSAAGQIPPELAGGTIAAHGKLTPSFEYIGALPTQLESDRSCTHSALSDLQRCARWSSSRLPCLPCLPCLHLRRWRYEK